MNDVPEVEDENAEVTEDMVLEIELESSDIDMIQCYELVSSANYGELSLAGMLCYEPNKDYEGEDRFGYRAYDEEGGYSEVATISITVEGGTIIRKDMQVR